MEVVHSEDVLEAGTGFMMSVSEILRHLEKRGYVENLTPKVDHFECQSGRYKIYPKDLIVDKMIRFENTSDPDDQAIVYAVSAPKMGIKGAYVEAYGINQDELSKDMIESLKHHLQ